MTSPLVILSETGIVSINTIPKSDVTTRFVTICPELPVRRVPFQTCALGLAASAVELSPPEGYYLFDVAPFKTPPKVRKPPYAQTSKPCPGESADL